MYFFCLLSRVLDLTKKQIIVCLDPRSNNFESGSATLVLSRNGLFTIFWLNLCDDIVWTLKMYEYHAGFKKQEYVLLDIDIINIEGRYDTVQKRNFLDIDWSFIVKTCFAIINLFSTGGKWFSIFFFSGRSTKKGGGEGCTSKKKKNLKLEKRRKKKMTTKLEAVGGLGP